MGRHTSRHDEEPPLQLCAAVWKTVSKVTLAGNRNRYEDELLEHLRDSMPLGVTVTILADRGFGDQERYRKISELGMQILHSSFSLYYEGMTQEDLGRQRHAHSAAPVTFVTLLIAFRRSALC